MYLCIDYKITLQYHTYFKFMAKGNIACSGKKLFLIEKGRDVGLENTLI